ncbi:MAG: hypothetical protein LBP59_19145 [Planctomycetaceae bacterium]|nr:hypothetical protein [Planctomycetaceae bacterium]
MICVIFILITQITLITQIIVQTNCRRDACDPFLFFVTKNRLTCPSKIAKT